MRAKGKITTWNDARAYGFITPFGGGRRLFIHSNAFGRNGVRPAVNDVVTYSLSEDNQGRPCAADAHLAGQKRKSRAARKTPATAILAALIFAVILVVAVITGHLSHLIVIGYAGLSLATFIAYALDKSAAKRGVWRISESTLLALGLAGGWPGALIAQQLLRHKSKKMSFRVAFWATVLLNCIALSWLSTER